MRRSRSPSRSLHPDRVRKVTLVVPEGCAEELWKLAGELRTRHHGGPGCVMPQWLAIGPDAEVMVDFGFRARCTILDICRGTNRFNWSVMIEGQLQPVAMGYTGKLARARSLAEAAFRAYVADRYELSSGHSGDG
jgi:hypothetical protein